MFSFRKMKVITDFIFQTFTQADIVGYFPSKISVDFDDEAEQIVVTGGIVLAFPTVRTAYFKFNIEYQRFLEKEEEWELVESVEKACVKMLAVVKRDIHDIVDGVYVLEENVNGKED